MFRYIFVSFLFMTSVNATEINYYDIAKNEAKKISESCEKDAFKHNPETTADMRGASLNANKCIEDAIKKEIKIGFNPDEQKKIEAYLYDAQKAISNYYWMIYNENKYCIGHCGTMGTLFNASDIQKVLVDMLEQVIFLNKKKNGY